MRSQLRIFKPSSLAAAWRGLYATRHAQPALAHWARCGGPALPSLDDARRRLEEIVAAPPQAVKKKGWPDLAEIKRGWATDALGRLDGGVDRHVCALAQRLAAVDMTDGGAFDAWLGVVAHASGDALAQARSGLSSRVVMHLSCVPRIERALDSCRSFDTARTSGVTQAIVVGSADAWRFEYDAARRVLTVPAPDTYEHLTAKVVSAMAFFALCGNVDAVLKVDDDHRLKDDARLAALFAGLPAAHAAQVGHRREIGALGNHFRAWHFGKCGDVEVNAEPYTLPGTSRWINGATGYLLNRPALRLLLWAMTYFPQIVRVGLYEDMTVSDLLERNGARLVDANLGRALGTVEEY